MSRSQRPTQPTRPADSPDTAKRTPRRSAVRSRYRPPFPAPILRLPAGRFRPRHCPNLDCRFYEPHADWRYSRWGVYHAPSCRQPIPRFQCRHCRRTFTARTFAATYWLHRFDLFTLIAQAAVAGSGVRPIARTFGVSHATVARHLTRAGRQSLVFHRQMVEKAPRSEPVVIDGFETFEYSQYFPCHYNLAVGHESWFLYHFTDSPLRRKGSMTPAQKKRRVELEARLGRPDPKAVENGIFELLQVMLATKLPGSGLGAQEDAAAPLPICTFYSDDHPAYGRAVRRLDQTGRGPVPLSLPPGGPATGTEETWSSAARPRLQHRTTPSTAPRTRANDLFPVNLADLLLRHSGADHRRETIAYDKRRQGGLERLAIFTVWRNAIKWRRENHPGETAAMKAGMATRRLRWAEVFACRRFPREHELPGSWWNYYWRRVKTAALGDRQTENNARFAF